MARPAVEHDPIEPEPSFEALRRSEEWTAHLALTLLPQTNGPRVEVYHGSVIVAPHAGFDHQAAGRELSYLLHRAARQAGLWAFPEVNLVAGDDLFIPDVAVLRKPGAGRSSANISEAVLLVEIVSDGNRRKDVIDRPRVYAEAGVPWFMRVELRRRVPAMVLFALVDREYQPIVAAAAGTPFRMIEPFEFTIDPASLLDD